ncbi:tetratricopeptide repeat protein [Neisseria sp. Ec49-e6-T10]|uniref:tetratricopeptide repeat protein n=1 Tax=Neisseria sp. Ec49-e6-T10 TaxID=3140744 RepID=UPI003EB9C05A
MFWYKKAAEQGDVVGQYNLGWTYREMKDIKQAKKWFDQACKNGHQHSCRLLKEME